METVLQNIKEDFNADRVVVALIHSAGSKNLESYHYLFSIKHEVVSLGMPRIKEYVKNKPLSILLNENKYYENNILFISSELNSFPNFCLNHLGKLQITTLINRYIFFEDIIIGLFSIQYKSLSNCPYKCKEDCLKDLPKLQLSELKITNNLFNYSH